MKKITFTLILLAMIFSAHAQRKLIDSLRDILSKKLDDTTRINTLLDLSHAYYISMPDSNIIAAQQAYALAEKHQLIKKQARALNNMANGYTTLGDYVKATQMFYRSLRISESFHDVFGMVRVYNNLGDSYARQDNYHKALDILIPANEQWEKYLAHHKLTDPSEMTLSPILLLNIGECYLELGKIDPADHYLQRSYKSAKEINFTDMVNNIERDLGEIELARAHTEAALKHLRMAVSMSISNDDSYMLCESYLSIAKLYHQNKKQDSAEYYARKAFDVAQASKFQQDILNAGKVLHTYYDEDHNLPLAYKYFQLATAAKDSIYSQEKVKQILSMDFEEKQHQQEIAAAQEQYQATVRMYALIAGLVVLLLLAIIFWRNSNQRKKANRLLQQQKEEIQTTLGELKTTQNQLVQSAKMASLGELTAGIAHEIQNPLNFVNNFSEVNGEMLQELRSESKKPKAERDEQLETDLIDSLIENERKINHHGKRADFIVKGMLEHSRTNTGERQPTNINTLADEFLKLSYHGLRAKDKSFNADLVTHFDADLPKISAVQQDIGRVLLNLYNNAFYAVHEKKKIAGNGYKPTVEVSTSRQNGSVFITVKDNGSGIPDNIKEKVMQPFFTTKPTGEGTGLGLSLSYDIVTKGHGGKIGINSKEGDGAEFIIQLPIETRS